MTHELLARNLGYNQLQQIVQGEQSEINQLQQIHLYLKELHHNKPLKALIGDPSNRRHLYSFSRPHPIYDTTTTYGLPVYIVPKTPTVQDMILLTATGIMLVENYDPKTREWHKHGCRTSQFEAFDIFEKRVNTFLKGVTLEDIDHQFSQHAQKFAGAIKADYLTIAE